MKEKTVRYYSTNLRSPEVTFREALLKGLAPDGGLYMPLVIPRLRQEDIEQFHTADYHDIAYTILQNFLRDEVPGKDLKHICRDAYDFEVPVEKVTGSSYILRLDRGPTASFKDFAARVMARLMNYFSAIDNSHFTILTATSGDTGSAVANAFHGLENINVIILYPHSEVTDIQRRQMTTLKKNVKVLAVDGKFDDCQHLVKRAFTDPLLSSVPLSSANSINIGRLLPQSVYYYYAWSRLTSDISQKVVFSVPSGNFGNIMGGLIARETGLPISRMIISTNRNDEVPEYLRSGIYKIKSPSINCISSAMNVGHPSNLARIVALYSGIMDENGSIVKDPNLEKMRRDFFAAAFSDDETRKAISDVYNRYGLILEPHGAVAWKGLESFLESTGTKDRDENLNISIETAHPAKFSEEVSGILGFSPPVPDSLMYLENKTEEYINLENNYEKLREFILKH